MPCRKDDSDNVQKCYPILVTGGNTVVRTAREDSTWTKKGVQSGACSYSVEFEEAYFCGPLEFIDNVVQECDNTQKKKLHSTPVRGTSADDNLMWKCTDCNKYSDTESVLQNPENVCGPQSPVRSHCVGCGIYKRTLETKARIEKK